MTEQEAKYEVLKRCRDDFFYFGKIISPKTFYLPTPEFHYEVVDMLMNRLIPQMCVQAPRGFGKSSLATTFILHHILFDPGDKVVVIQSKTRDEAINRLTKIKNILNYSKNFINLFGYAGEAASETKMWRENKIQTRIDNLNVSIKAIGTGQPARGTLESGIEQQADGSWDIGDDTRITLYYLDDPDDEDNTKTADAMANNFDKFVGSKEGMDSRTGRVIVVGTIIRAGCIVHKLLNMAGWVTQSYQNNLARGITIWPELRSLEWLQNKKNELASAYKLSRYYSEYEGTLTGDDDRTFEEEDIQWWDGYLETEHEDSYLHITHLGREKAKNNEWQMILLEEEIILPVNTYLGIDPASSRKPGADFSVTMPIAYDERKNIYVLPYFEKRVKPTEHAKQITDKYLEIRPKRTYVETTAYQEALKSMIEEWMLQNNEMIPGIKREWKPRTEKDDRLMDLERFTNAQKIHLQPGMGTLWDEFTQFPRGRKNLLDGLWYATRRLTAPLHKREEKHYTDDELMFINGHRKRHQQGNWRVA